MKPQKIDWFRITADLKKHNLSHLKIGLKLGTSPNCIANWRQGTEPSFNRGEALINLWCKVTGKTFNDVPRVGSERAYEESLSNE